MSYASDFQEGDTLDVLFIGPCFFVADMGPMCLVETVESQARAMVPADWCALVLNTQDDDLGAAMAAAEVAPVEETATAAGV